MRSLATTGPGWRTEIQGQTNNATNNAQVSPNALAVRAAGVRGQLTASANHVPLDLRRRFRPPILPDMGAAADAEHLIDMEMQMRPNRK